jgi:phage terminase small subunit
VNWRSTGCAAAARLLANVSIRARVEEILAAGAERAEITVEQVLRELAVLGFSDIGKVVRWRPELVAARRRPTSACRRPAGCRL